MSGSDAPATNAYWGRDGLEEKILDALAAAGKNVDSLTIDDLAPADQFHGGGKGATERLARLAGLKSGTRVLDVGGGLGGPARTLAGQFGCRVTVVDLTESYVRTGTALTARLGLADRVTHGGGDARADRGGGRPGARVGRRHGRGRGPGKRRRDPRAQRPAHHHGRGTRRDRAGRSAEPRRATDRHDAGGAGAPRASRFGSITSNIRLKSSSRPKKSATLAASPSIRARPCPTASAKATSRRTRRF